MPKYIYKCEPCNFKYVEIRDVDQEQIFKQHACGVEYTEITE
jgi:hypothetical protein